MQQGAESYPGDIRVPVVKGHIILHQLRQDGNLGLGVIVEDLRGQLGLVDIVTVAAQLLIHEPLLLGGELATRDGRVVRVKGTVELDVVTRNRMVRVVENGIVVLGSTAHGTLGGVGETVRIAVRAVVERILKALDCLTTEHIVQRAVLHFQDHHVLDLVLEVLDGGRGMGLGTSLRGRRHGGRQGQQAEQSTGMHIELGRNSREGNRGSGSARDLNDFGGDSKGTYIQNQRNNGTGLVPGLNRANAASRPTCWYNLDCNKENERARSGGCGHAAGSPDGGDDYPDRTPIGWGREKTGTTLPRSECGHKHSKAVDRTIGERLKSQRAQPPRAMRMQCDWRSTFLVVPWESRAEL